MNIQLDFRSDVPITNQIVNQIQQMIAANRLKPGDQLPTVRALASDLRINFNTVARAYRNLDEAGIISTQQGRGTYILEMPPPETTKKLRQESLALLATRFLDEAQKLGFTHQQALDQVRKRVSE